MKSLSRVQLFATPWTVAYQAPLFMEFSRQEYWTGLPFPSPGDLPDPGIEPRSPALQANALPSEPQGSPNLYFSISLLLGTVLLCWIFLRPFLSFQRHINSLSRSHSRYVGLSYNWQLQIQGQASLSQPEELMALESGRQPGTLRTLRHPLVCLSEEGRMFINPENPSGGGWLRPSLLLCIILQVRKLVHEVISPRPPSAGKYWGLKGAWSGSTPCIPAVSCLLNTLRLYEPLASLPEGLHI